MSLDECMAYLETETSEDLERRRCDTALVRRAVLEQDDTLLLEVETRLLGDEQVGALDDGLEVRLAVRVEEAGDVRDVDRLGLRAARRSASSPGGKDGWALTLPPQGTKMSDL